MKQIDNYLLPRITEDLFTNEAKSSIALSKEVANKVNELVDSYNELIKTRYDKMNEQDGRIRQGILYMKDNLANTINELLKIMKDNGELESIITSAISKDIENLKIKTEFIVNVKEYGATGDGITDDTLAIKRCFETFKNIPTKIIFPKGTYLIKDNIYLYSNTSVEFNNSTIKATGTVLFLNNKESLDLKGYGAIKNIKLENGYFTAKDNNIIKIALLHGENINANNITFDGCMYGNHVFDLGGCKNVIIDNCKFTNVSLRNEYKYVELIQLDYANYSGIPYWSESSKGYDLLACKNIKVINCIFEKGENGTHYPNAIGSHGFFDNMQDGLHIENCKFYGWTYSAIRPLKCKNITIINNYFETLDVEGTLPGILIESGDNASYKFKASENIIIKNNTFISKGTSKRRFIYITGASSEKLHNKIIVSSNIYNGTYDGIDSTSGADFIQLDYAKNINITGNIVENAKNFIYSENYLANTSLLNNRLVACRTLKNTNTTNGLTVDNKNILCVSLASDYTGTSVNEEKLPLTAIVGKSGDLLSISNGSIKIGSGISQIKVSSLMSVKTPSGENAIHSISIKRTRGSSTVSLAEARIRPSGAYETCSIPDKILNVEENDLISLYVQSSSVGEVISSTTYLTVEVIM